MVSLLIYRLRSFKIAHRPQCTDTRRLFDSGTKFSLLVERLLLRNDNRELLYLNIHTYAEFSLQAPTAKLRFGFHQSNFRRRVARRKFPFRKQAMSFLTVDAIPRNQAFAIRLAFNKLFKLLPLVSSKGVKDLTTLYKLKSGDFNQLASKYFEFCSDERLRSYTSNELKINSVKTELFKGT